MFTKEQQDKKEININLNFARMEQQFPAATLTQANPIKNNVPNKIALTKMFIVAPI